MNNSDKYSRTFHFDFSVGATSDDRINVNWYEDTQNMDKAIILEKMDGENTCLNEYGKFARSHSAPTTNPWSRFLDVRYEQIREDLKKNQLEIFGENLYAIHSIIYPNLDDHFKVFAIRSKGVWLGWEEVKWIANFYDFHVVPEFDVINTKEMTRVEIQNKVLSLVKNSSTFESLNVGTNEPCTMEGIVMRNYGDFPVGEFQKNVFKYVRSNHVKTDQHWVKNWKRAPLVGESNK